MAKIAIVTDSTAAIPPEVAQELNIFILPLVVNLGEDSFKEGIDIHTDQFFQLLESAPILPTTSQPAVGDMIQTFEKALAAHDQVIAVLLSSGLSGTYASAVTAANMVGGDITVIDSQITSEPMARMAIEAATMARDGKNKEEILAHVERLIRTAKAFFVVDQLDHLHRGGRIGGAAALFGSLLQIKPILTVQDGKIELFEKVRTKRKALDRIIELVKQNIDPDHLQINVIHTRRLEEAQQLEQRVSEEFPGAITEIHELSPVISTHVGPGILALFYYQRP
ncbi:DegV family protein [Fodinisporobacter ferrooxydans]|uniref:DegV family protein n=1 Tax=Fodinisporobacter ferrooxydans TaxID=2901836 RepID=A0ABY4CLN8_9BACL|nr:DegV family protein [Alicyclobacillaceae bacterium MYW30-H2]